MFVATRFIRTVKVPWREKCQISYSILKRRTIEEYVNFQVRYDSMFCKFCKPEVKFGSIIIKNYFIKKVMWFLLGWTRTQEPYVWGGDGISCFYLSLYTIVLGCEYLETRI